MLIMRNKLYFISFSLILIGVTIILVISPIDIFFPLRGYSDKITVSGLGGSNGRGLYLLNWKEHYFERLTPIEVYAMHPTWSPSGEYLAFIYYTDISIERKEGIGIVDNAVGNVNYYLFGEPAGGEQLSRLAWSPDGHQILFNTWSNYDENLMTEPRFYLLQVDSGQFQNVDLHLGKFQSERPVNFAWSSSDVLALEKKGKLYTVNLETMQLTLLAEGTNPFWTPDGEWLTFLCKKDKVRFCRIMLDGNTIEEIPLRKSINISTNIYSPFSWSTDGRFILFMEASGESDPVYINVLDTKTGRVQRIYNSHWYDSDYISVLDAVSYPH